MKNRLCFAEVRQVEPDKDCTEEDAAKWQCGYVKVRVYGEQDNEDKILDCHLPFAIPVQDITSAAVNGIGKSPTGMLVGSTVLICYLDNEHPLILGTVARAGSSKSRKPEEGFNDVDDSNGDVPPASKTVPFNDHKTNYQAKIRGSQELPASTAYSPDVRRYNNIDYTQISSATDVKSKAIEQNASRYRKYPTIGSVPDTGIKDVLTMIKSVDPTGKSSVLPNAVDNIKKIFEINNATSTGGLSGLLGGSLGNVFSSLSSVTDIANLVKNLGSAMNVKGSNNLKPVKGKTDTTDPDIINFINVVNDMMDQLGGFTDPNETISAIPSEYKQALYDGLLELLTNTNKDFSVTVPDKGYSNGSYVSIPKEKILAEAPDGYLEVFSYITVDPYPGYIKWEGPNGEDVYTVRPITKPYCSTPSEDAINSSVPILLTNLKELIRTKKLDINTLIELLKLIFGIIEDTAHQNTFGKNVKKNNFMQYLQQLLGPLGSAINSAKTGHLPQSVLNQSKVNEALEKYSKRVAIANKQQKLGKDAVGRKNPRPPSASPTSPPPIRTPAPPTQRGGPVRLA